MNSLKVFSVGDIHFTPETTVGNLRPRVQETCGEAFRRTNRFGDLALIGANRCAAASPRRPGSDCPIYLGTGQCNLADTIQLMREIHASHQPPMPFTFINTASNTAGFHIGQSLGLTGENITVSRETFPFEAVLELAWLAMVEKRAQEALVGVVDELTAPLEHHRHRLQLPPTTAIGEGSHWLHVGQGSDYIGELTHLERFSDEAALVAAVETWHGEHGAWLAGGNNMGSDEVNRLALRLGVRAIFGYTEAAGYYECNAGYALVRFTEDRPGPALIHINRDRHGRYAAFRLELSSERAG